MLVPFVFNPPTTFSPAVEELFTVIGFVKLWPPVRMESHSLAVFPSFKPMFTGTLAFARLPPEAIHISPWLMFTPFAELPHVCPAVNFTMLYCSTVRFTVWFGPAPPARSAPTVSVCELPPQTCNALE